MTAIERLEQLMEDQDERIHELENQLESAKALDDWAWCRANQLPAQQSLPVPRLEIELEHIDEKGYNYTWTYSLVYRHLLGNCVRIPLGHTRCGGATRIGGLNEQLPFRDGAHIRFDAAMFGFPAFAIFGDQIEPVPPLSPERMREHAALTQKKIEEEISETQKTKLD